MISTGRGRFSLAVNVRSTSVVPQCNGVCAMQITQFSLEPFNLQASKPSHRKVAHPDDASNVTCELREATSPCSASMSIFAGAVMVAIHKLRSQRGECRRECLTSPKHDHFDKPNRAPQMGSRANKPPTELKHESIS